jgi:hypothetical protein
MEDVEELVYQYMIKNGRSPKYILLDKDSYDQFNKRAVAKERIAGVEAIKEYRVVTLHSSHSTLPIDILSIDTYKTIFEAVS